MRRILTATTALFALGVIFVACDDDGGGGGEGRAEAPVDLQGDTEDKGTGRASGGAVELEADDFYFEPTFVEATAGTVEFTVTNESDARHTFTIDAQGIDEEIAPGDEVTVDVEASDAEAFNFYCRFHRGRGMQGALFTEAGQQVGGGGTPPTSGSGGGGTPY
jgi:plastocyanin